MKQFKEGADEANKELVRQWLNSEKVDEEDGESIQARFARYNPKVKKQEFDKVLSLLEYRLALRIGQKQINKNADSHYLVLNDSLKIAWEIL